MVCHRTIPIFYEITLFELQSARMHINNLSRMKKLVIKSHAEQKSNSKRLSEQSDFHSIKIKRFYFVFILITHLAESVSTNIRQIISRLDKTNSTVAIFVAAHRIYLFACIFLTVGRFICRFFFNCSKNQMSICTCSSKYFSGQTCKSINAG